MKKTLLPLAAASLLFFACNNAGSKDSVDKADSANAAKMDSSTAKSDTAKSSMAAQPVIKADENTTNFLVKAANGGLAEVALGQMAKEKGTSASVKEFADMMVTDHTGANDKVKALAAARNVTLPSAPDADHQKKADDLSKKTGNAFDKDYVDAMVKGHKETVDMFKNASSKVTDAEVKSFIDNTLPTLEHHLQRIQEIKKGMK